MLTASVRTVRRQVIQNYKTQISLIINEKTMEIPKNFVESGKTGKYSRFSSDFEKKNNEMVSAIIFLLSNTNSFLVPWHFPIILLGLFGTSRPQG